MFTSRPSQRKGLNESISDGAGGGIRTHEGLRHRVLSPRQAGSRLLPIRPGSGTPALQIQRQGRSRGRIKTTSRHHSFRIGLMNEAGDLSFSAISDKLLEIRPDRDLGMAAKKIARNMTETQH